MAWASQRSPAQRSELQRRGLETMSEDDNEIMEEDDYVNEILLKQRALAGTVAPEDAFVSSLPPNVHARLFQGLPAAPPPPPPPQSHVDPHEQSIPYSSYLAFTSSEQDETKEAQDAPGQANQAVSHGTSAFDFLSCGFATAPMFTADGRPAFLKYPLTLPSGSSSRKAKAQMPRDPTEFAPLGGALCIELHSVAGLVKVNRQCDPWVVARLVNADGRPIGGSRPTVWPAKKSTTHPCWQQPRFVGPPGYTCGPGDRVEFEVYQGIVAGSFDVSSGTWLESNPGLATELTSALVGVCTLENLDALSYEALSTDFDANPDDAPLLTLPVTRTLNQLLSFRLQLETERQTQRARDAVLFATEDLQFLAAQGTDTAVQAVQALRDPSRAWSAWTDNSNNSSTSGRTIEFEEKKDNAEDAASPKVAPAKPSAALFSMFDSPVFSAAQAAQKSCELTCRVLPPPPSVKRVYFVRHGQSEWNRATEDTYNVKDMLAVDHPLSEQGIQEAINLRAAIHAAGAPSASPTEMMDSHTFMRASRVISSSLTRALQTALVVLHDHPAVANQPGYLMMRPECRELKNTLGLDTMSAFRGDAIVTRAKSKCARSEALHLCRPTNGKGGEEAQEKQPKKKKKSGAVAKAVSGVVVDASVPTDQWWDYLESSEDKDRHVAGLVEMVRTAPGRSLIIVGHSLLFRQLMATYAAPSVDPKFGVKKLSNCSVMAVDFDFGYFASAAAESTADSSGSNDARAFMRRGNLPGLWNDDVTSNSSEATSESPSQSEGAAAAEAAKSSRPIDDGCKPIRAAKLVFGSTFHA